MIKKIVIIILITIVLCLFFSFIFAATTEPTIIKKLNTALNDIKRWLIKLATPAAAVAICSGVMIKKFSFGDEERMIMGQKIIRSSIWSYIIILSVDLILKTIESFI